MAKQDTKAMTPRLRFPEFRDRDGWKGVLLGDASTPVSERVGERKLTPVSISAGIGFVPQAEKFGRDISGNQYALYTLLRDGDFVYNKGNSMKFPQGCVYQLRGWGEVAAPNVFISFRLKQGFVAEYFQYCFERNIHGIQLQRHITSGARSNGLLNVSKDQFFGVEIATPQRDEQQRIADCLTSLDEVIAAQGRKVEALKAHKRGLMQQIFPREGETRPRLRFPEFRNAPEWRETRLSSLGRLIPGLTYSPIDVREEGLLVLRSSNVQNAEIALEDNVYVVPNIKGANLAEPNDILICVRNGSKALIGKSALVPENMPICTHGAFMTMLRAHVPKFVFQLLQSASFRQQVEADLGATINSINGAQLMRYRFLVPKKDEQLRIAGFLSSFDSQLAAETHQLAALKAHKHGLMQQLFPAPESMSA